MSILPTTTFALQPTRGPRLTLRSDEGHVAHLFVLECDILRLMVLPHGRLRAPRTWAIALGEADVPHAGRDRFDLSGFTLPDYTLDETPDTLQLQTRKLRFTVRKSGLLCTYEVLHNGRFQLVTQDRRTQAHNLGFWDDRVYHYLTRHDDEKYFGLGERTGDLDRSGQRFRLCNLDAMGYCARTSDPLYKHIPFYITWRQLSGAACGLFYDTLSDCVFDFGKERDNYHGAYRYFMAEHGDLDLYFIGGDTIADIVKRYTWLTGRPAFMPRWSLGYSGSTMAYTDAPNAQQRMDEFLERCGEHDILCDSFHLSSGYSTRNGKRYVFTWDRDKFADPAGFARRFLDHGVRLCANVKPCLLRDHPLFESTATDGLFISDGVHHDPQRPFLAQFWDDAGAYLDFTNPKTDTFFQQQITQSLLEQGIAAIWNDNNEYELFSPRAKLGDHASSRDAWECKPLQPLLMMRAARQAQQNFAPRRRPFVVSRSGAAGMQRYAQTWSGDNYTSWETLRYNLRMGLGLALSGVSNHGHDIGGFAGPAPSPELFLRWLQCGVFLPRFSIHSWNSDGSVSEPWMYPELLSQVRELFRLRYCLIPYLYELMYRAHTEFEAILRPTFYDFPDDVRCYEACDEAMLGPSLLIAPVVEPDQLERSLYLPSGNGWYCLFSGAYYAGGVMVTLPAPWSHPVVLAKEGTIIPLNIAEQHFAHPAHAPAFALFPPRATGEVMAEFFSDDGESDAYREGNHGAWKLRLRATAATLHIDVQLSGRIPPPADSVTLLLPATETRAVHISGARQESDCPADRPIAPHRAIRLLF